MSGRASNSKREIQYHPDCEFQLLHIEFELIPSQSIAMTPMSAFFHPTISHSGFTNQNLQAHSTIFPTVNESPRSRNEIVRMTERAEILYIVFKYIYPEPPHPKLDDMEFALLEEVAITADKYQFTSLLYICDPRMERVSCFNSSQGTYP